MSVKFLRPVATILLVICCLEVALAKIVRLRCMWRDDPATTMVIGWDQVSGGNPVLHYGLQDGGKNPGAYGNSIKPARTQDAKSMRNHFARLTNLQPNTKYYFIIQDSEDCSVSFSFRTAPNDPNQRLSIIAGGDSRNHREARRNANILVGKLKPHCVMFGGDMTASDSDKSWMEWFDDWQYTMGRTRQLIPIIPARGNHEASNQSIVDLFDVKSSDVYYGLSLGGGLLRIYTLNTLIPSGGSQKAWLENDLKKNQRTNWRFAQYHHTMRPHTASKPEKDELLVNWATLFHKYNMNLVVESDAHVVKSTYPIRPSSGEGSQQGFVRDDKSGTVYVGEGCWGAPLRANNDDKAWTRASGKFNQFKWIFVDQKKVEVRTVKTDCAPQVVELRENNLFNAQCKGLQLWAPPTGAVVTLKPRVKEAPSIMGKLRPDQKGLVGITINLKQAADVQAILVNKQMQQLATVPYNGLSAGSHTKSLNVSKVPPGEYIILVKANQKVIQRYELVK